MKSGARITSRTATVAIVLLLSGQTLQNAAANGDTRTLSFHHLHTKEDITVTFKRNGRYDDEALKKLDWFMRDWRKEQSVQMNPQLFDIIWEAYRQVNGKEPIQIICGYRSPETNSMLRARSSGVAQASHHTKGEAIDFYIPGAPLEELRNVGLRMQRGGVGFYPTSGSPFVHLDVGNIRHWPRLTHDQLVKVFPDGRTVHIPSDGQPLANYQLALADIERRGGTVATNAYASNVNEDDNAAGKPVRNLLASLFGFKKTEEPAPTVETPAPAPKRVAAARVAPAPSAPPAAALSVTPVAMAKAEIGRTDIVPLPAARPAVKPVQVAAIAPPKPKKDTKPDVIAQRGYWAGAVESAPLPVTLASADPNVTASVGAMPANAMAYAPAAVETPVQRARPMGVTPSAPPAMLTQSGASTIVAKPSVVENVLVSEPSEPWLRATVLAPSAQTYLTATRWGAADARELRAFLTKPSSAVVMTFSADPHYGLVAEHFTGKAVEFVATATFGVPTRSAALQ